MNDFTPLAHCYLRVRAPIFFWRLSRDRAPVAPEKGHKQKSAGQGMVAFSRSSKTKETLLQKTRRRWMEQQKL